jgi:DnaJ family protein B protein 4
VQVLIDAEKRRAYDEGREIEAALDCGSEGAKSIDHAMEVFAGVFGFRSPLEIDAEKRAGFEGALEKVFSSALELGSAPEVISKAPPIERKLLCTLEELYNGSSRKVKITRTHTDAQG